MPGKIYEGVVMRSADRTVKVFVEYLRNGGLKRVKESKNILAHDDHGCVIGDLVEILECARYSKNKAFKVVKVNGVAK